MRVRAFLAASALLLPGVGATQVPPVRTQVMTIDQEIKAFYDAAVELSRRTDPSKKELDRFHTAATRAGRTATSVHKYADVVLKRGYALADDVRKTRGRISAMQYADYRRILEGIENDLDKIDGTGTSAAGDPAPGTLGECWKSCNDAVGPGFGGGKGFDRFGCKAGCIITKLPPGK